MCHYSTVQNFYLYEKLCSNHHLIISNSSGLDIFPFPVLSLNRAKWYSSQLQYLRRHCWRMGSLSPGDIPALGCLAAGAWQQFGKQTAHQAAAEAPGWSLTWQFMSQKGSTKEILEGETKYLPKCQCYTVRNNSVSGPHWKPAPSFLMSKRAEMKMAQGWLMQAGTPTAVYRLGEVKPVGLPSCNEIRENTDYGDFTA